jgi:transposase
MKILALDLGKNKSVWCEYQTESMQETYVKTVTTPQALQELLVEHKPDRLVLEVGPSAGWVCDVAEALGIPTQVANPNHEAWRWRNVKKKTDRVDALKLAQLSAMGQLPLVHMPGCKTRQWRSLIAYRQSLVDRRTAVKNHIRAVYERQGLRLPGGKKAWSQAAIAQWSSQDARPLSEVGPEELWRGELYVEWQQLKQVEQSLAELERKLSELAQADERCQRLQTAPAVGPRLSEMVVALVDDPKRFSSGKEVGAYAGLTPRQWQSGESDRQGHISRAGNAQLRRLLIQVAWIGVRNKTWMLEVFERIKRGSDKRKKVAITAVARQLFIRLWAMLRDQTEWREPTTRFKPTAMAA